LDTEHSVGRDLARGSAQQQIDAGGIAHRIPGRKAGVDFVVSGF
jgi:hypothetical protein